MNQHRSYDRGDDQPVAEGDGAFLGVDLRRDPGQLEPGLLADAVNLRFREGRAAPRRGIRLLAWGARHEAGYGPGDVLPYGNVAGAGVFNDPLGSGQWLIIATTSGVFKARPGTTGSAMPLPSGFTIPERVQIIQTFSGLVMLRGADLDPIFCNDLDVGWRALPVADSGKVPLPPSSNGVYFQNRLFVINEDDDPDVKDGVFVSDFGTVNDALQGDALYNNFRINQGSRDSLVGLYRFNDTTLLCFKEDSVYVVANVSGVNSDINTNAQLDAVTTEYGLRAPKAVVQVGNDVWFLAHRRGVCSIRQTEQNKLQGVDVPVSRDIDPLIKRINWQHAGNATMAFWDNKVYVAVPLDDADYNNTVLVFDTVTQRWAGRDTSAMLQVFDWLKLSYAGETRLIYVSDDGYICLYEDGYHDQVPAALGQWTMTPIATSLLTRGYGGQVIGRKRFTQARVSLRTWNPEYTVGYRTDGVNEAETLVADVTADRTEYLRPHDAAAYDPENPDDDHATPYRADYSVDVDDDGVNFGTAGLDVDRHQETERAWRLRVQGRYVQVEMTGTQGRTEVAGVGLEIIRGSPRFGQQV
jgi:hypothetical protein